MAESLGADVAPVQLGADEAVSQMLGETGSKALDSSFEMRTYIANLTSKLVYNGEQKLWPVTLSATSPGRIASGNYTISTYGGTLPAGVKFGRVYYDAPEQLPTTRKFVFAFDSPAGKVYAETGPTGPVDWNVVEDRLGKSGSTTEVVDDILKGKIIARVNDNGNGYVEFRDA